MQCSDYNTIHQPELKDMFLRIILPLLFSVSASLGRTTNSLDVTLVDEENKPGAMVDVTLDDEHSQHSNSLVVALDHGDSQPGSLVDVTLDDEHSHHSNSLDVALVHEENLFDETLAGEDNQIEELTRMSNENQGLADRVDVTSLAIEESEEKMKSDEKSLIVWRLINIAAGSFLVIVFINMTAMLTILLGWNLLA